MIERNDAEQLAHAIHILRHDWPTKQLLTLIGELKDYPLRDLGCALIWVALERDHDGAWTTKSPYRVKEDGPWWDNTRRSIEEIKAKRQYDARVEEAYATIRERSERIRACSKCDENGFVGNLRCRHPALATVQDRSL